MKRRDKLWGPSPWKDEWGRMQSKEDRLAFPESEKISSAVGEGGLTDLVVEGCCT